MNDFFRKKTNEYKTEANLNEIKRLREVETSSKAFDISLNNVLEINGILVDASKATMQLFFDVGLFDRFEIEDEISKIYITFNKRRRGEIEVDK